VTQWPKTEKLWKKRPSNWKLARIPKRSICHWQL
jgi:hypothetical protein